MLFADQGLQPRRSEPIRRPDNLVLGCLLGGQADAEPGEALSENHDSFGQPDFSLWQEPGKRIAKRPTNLRLEGELQARSDSGRRQAPLRGYACIDEWAGTVVAVCFVVQVVPEYKDRFQGHPPLRPPEPIRPRDHGVLDGVTILVPRAAPVAVPAPVSMPALGAGPADAGQTESLSQFAPHYEARRRPAAKRHSTNLRFAMQPRPTAEHGLAARWP